MGTTGQVQHLLGLSGLSATVDDSARMLSDSLPLLLEIAGADAAVVVERHGEGASITHAAGLELGLAPIETTGTTGTTETTEDTEDTGGSGLGAVTVPEQWRALGITTTRARRLPGHLGLLVLAWSGEQVPSAEVDLATAILEGGLSRAVALSDLRDLTARVDNAQHLAQMGDYDWHIPSDTNRWSDQLFRIYGYEPQTFNPSYEKFLSLIHPDDRERITGVHQQAYATGEPYQMIERIVRPDGETRYLSSNGEVVMDEQGVPQRMRGTCIDITERVLAEREREILVANRSEAQLRRRQALEINDNVVQGLVAAAYALDAEQFPVVASYLDRTLAAARSMMDDLLEPLDGQDLAPGDLVRSHPATIGVLGPDDTDIGAGDAAGAGAASPPAPDSADGHRVLVVDDAADLRRLMRDRLERTAGYTVVGEAGDGLEAVELARTLQPDLVLLDLAMPRMDGLEALPHIRAACPDVRVIVFSGFDQGTLAGKALAAGADRYVVKGGSMRALLSILDEVLQPVR